ncbi:winged helix-turn-helix transcriptional regulator [Naasia lichenicola]|uniref:Helix-turn-helix transcriptional regulator n=1 Tax=Naasia lichenicola TaxID=2565933 RepID=A0A4S4FKS9_9MICO|nr:helix-turn-helix domain-containing protein [Naasia lichenicola]THG29905.1 helix-turn-helix transcriptional regulator [Naasia lichenicola]
MQLDEHEGRMCDATVSLAFAILGKPWNGMILEVLGNGAITYSAVRRAVPGISDAVLSSRLTDLADAGLVTREVDAGPPTIVRYSLAKAGIELMPLLRQLGSWASSNLDPALAASVRANASR